MIIIITADRISDTRVDPNRCLQQGISDHRSISGSLAGIAVMKAADQGQFDAVALVGRFDCTQDNPVPATCAGDVLGDLPRVCFPVLNLNADWLGNFGTVVGAQAGLEACIPRKAAVLGSRIRFVWRLSWIASWAQDSSPFPKVRTARRDTPIF